MPIDYSRFDRIGDDDDEDEEPRYGGRGGRGGGGGGADDKDFERLLRCLQQQAEKEGDAEPPDLYTAAGLGGAHRTNGSGAGHKGRGGGLDAPGAATPSLGLDSLDPLAALSGGYGGRTGSLDDDLGASRALDLPGLRSEAWCLLCSRLVVLPGPAEAVPRALLLEAEVHLLSSRYRQALVAALAVQLATATASTESPFGDWTAPTMALDMVCSYQLGDRDRAMELRGELQKMDRSMLSAHLAKRFEGTSEVLELVPHFLNLLRAAEQDKLAEEDDDLNGVW